MCPILGDISATHLQPTGPPKKNLHFPARFPASNFTATLASTLGTVMAGGVCSWLLILATKQGKITSPCSSIGSSIGWSLLRFVFGSFCWWLYDDWWLMGRGWFFYLFPCHHYLLDSFRGILQRKKHGKFICGIGVTGDLLLWETKNRIDLHNLLVQKSAAIASSFKHVAPWWERPGTLSARTATPLSVEASGDDAICQTTFVAIRGRDNVDSYKSTVSCNP